MSRFCGFKRVASVEVESAKFVDADGGRTQGVVQDMEGYVWIRRSM
jgi:hypothetical protein